MRNAGASIDPPTDPFAAIPLPTPPVTKGKSAKGGKARASKQRPGESGTGGNGNGRKLPPGVSPDIFGPSDSPSAGGPGSDAPAGSGLPPVPPPAQPWPTSGPPERRHPVPLPGSSNGAEEPGSFGGGPSVEIPHPGPPRRRPRRVGFVVAAVVLLLGLAYAVPAVIMSGAILPGTTVLGVDLGGLTVSQAADRVRERLEERSKREIPARALGVPYEIIPERAGLELDIASTVGQAPSGFPGPLEVWRGLTGTTEIDPKVTVDEVRLTEAVEGLAKKIDRPVREGEIRYEGIKPKIEVPRDGTALELNAAATAIKDGYLSATPGPIDLPVTVVRPKVTAEEFKTTAGMARKAVAAPIVLSVGGKRARIPVTVLAANLAFEPDKQGELRPSFDAEKALATVESRLVDPSKAPVEARYDIVGGAPKLIPGKPGMGVDADKLADDVETVVREGGSRTIPVTLVEIEPRVSEAEVRKLGIKEKISEATTNHPCCAPRVTNIQTIAKLLDGHLVKPGETFSLNEIIGRRDTARGFVMAPQIMAGRLVNDVGGGISQFVTTMYNAVFFAGLKDVKHTPHEFYISRYPAGLESTVSYPQPDFQWQNNSKHGVLIKTSFTSTSITVTFWGTKRYDKIKAISSERHSFTDFTRETDDKPGCIPMVGQRGFTIEVTRVFYQGDKVIKRDPAIRTVYRPETDVKCTSASGSSGSAPDEPERTQETKETDDGR
ncbi:VanW family protein [Spongiactinospora sp. TRM90649]|uniref:VanW family protein n=1 Tax=Spongiactinospora sp. TRM90649 TaxID=3031114 RepID=UPI0023F7D753|nr:VanW family protein [Spongiactinospora sp. TRM90649]MDF5753396.1 VanW family protein [Spongiactinospora sp. TRM90649]